jgi:hypothetical protein
MAYLCPGNNIKRQPFEAPTIDLANLESLKE